MSPWCTRIFRQVCRLAATALIGGAITAAMVRTGPGYDSDERLLDARLSAASRAAIRIKHFNLGYSESFQQPVATLIGQRWRETAGLMFLGFVGAWTLAFSTALLAVVTRKSWLSGLAGLAATFGLCMPAAIIAVLMFLFGGPTRIVIALILFPRLFETLRNLLAESYRSQQVLNARSLGLSAVTILRRYVLPARAPELLALAGVSLVMAFGACIPVESLCDLPGIGQLAWKAATARDLPLLVVLTVLIALLTQLCNAISEWITPEVA